MRSLAIAILIFLTFIAFMTCTFVTTEYNQAIIVQFGKPVGDPVIEAGLHFKKPLIQKVKYFDKRILEWDGDPNQIPTKDKKYIKIDVTARWKIIDPLKFYQTVREETGAHARLDDVIDGETRNVVSNHLLVEVVRNTNDILENFNEDISGEEQVKMEKINFGREKLTEEIFTAASLIVPQYGIQLIDVKIKRINYEASVQDKVFERMISERKRIAEKFRSVGKGEKAKILGKMSRKLKRIESEAYKAAQEIQGKGDAEAANIYARAYGGASEFYRFMKSLESYETSIKKDNFVILSTGSDYLKYMKKIK